jgi:hypothetical protein
MEYICNHCNKKYASYQSRCNHIRRYHKNERQYDVNESDLPVNVPSIETSMLENNNDLKYSCSKCKKPFKFRQGKWAHEKVCKENIEEEKNEIEEIKNKNIKMEKEIENLKTMLQKALKIHPKTLNKINNQLNNSGTINNITIIQLGRENLNDVLTEKQKKSILDRQAMSINHLVDLIHVSGKYKKFKNVYITNLQSTFAYKFDEKLNKFIAVNKNELLSDIVDSRMYDIQKFYDDVYPELEPKKAEQIKKFIDRMGNEEDELKDIKKEEIKLILYNNREKILPKEEAVILIKDNKNIDMN